MVVSAPDGSNIAPEPMAEGNWSFATYKSGAQWWNGSLTYLGADASPRSASSNGYVTGYNTSWHSTDPELAVGWRVTGGTVTKRLLPVPTTGTYPWSCGYGVNNRGLMVGNTIINADTQAWAYDWASTDTAILPALDIKGEAADSMSASAVNDAGQVVGSASTGSWKDAYVWTSGGGVASLGMTTVHDVDVWDLSENGYVVGKMGETVFRKKIGEANWVDTGLPTTMATDGGVNNAGWVAFGENIYRDGEVENIADLLVDGSGFGWFNVIDINNRGVMIGQARQSRTTGTTKTVLLLPVAGENKVPNPDFGTTDGLSYVGDVTVVSDPLDAGNSCLQMTTASPVYVDQQVDTPNGSFEIAFDYRFLDEGGTLAVELNGVELELIGPSMAADPDWVNYGFLVTDETLYDLNDVAMRITLNHEDPGKRILLDNLELRVINEIPEPATLALLAAGGFGALLRRRRDR